MTKNMTRKGLAFGAGLAMLGASFVTLPSVAAVDDTAVSLTPSAGTQYSMVTDGVFDLKSTQSVAATAGSGKLKYLVTDVNKISRFDYQADTTVTTADTNMPSEDFESPASDNTGDVLSIAYNESTKTATIDDAEGGDDLFANLAVGDIVKLTGVNSASITTAFTGWVEVASATADSFTFILAGFNGTDNVGTDGDIATEVLSAGTFIEASVDDELDSYDVMLAGSLGVAGVTELAAPTRESDGSYVIVGPTADPAKSDLLRLIGTAAGSVTVTAWIDENTDGVIDSTESSSSARTVTFITWANSGATIAFDNPVAGADWDVQLNFNSTMNAAQIPSARLDIALGVLEDGTLEKAVANTTADGTVFTAATDPFAYDATPHPGIWSAQLEVDANLDGNAATDFVAGYTYAAQLFLDTEAYGEVTYSNNLSSEVADLVGAVTATRGDNVRQSSIAAAGAIEVRPDYTGAVEFKALLTVADATVAGNPTGAGVGRVTVPAGTEATITVAEGSGDLDTDSTVTTGGKTLVFDGTAVTYTVVSDANGYVTFSLTNNLGEVGDDLTVTVTHAGRSVNSSVIWTAVTPADAVLQGETQVSINQKGSYSINYTAADEFGAALTGPNYRVEVSYFDKVGGVTKATGVTLDANGKGTLTVADLSTSNGSYVVNADLQKLNTSAAFADFGTPEEIDTTVTVTSNITAAAVTAVATADDADADGTVMIEADAGFAVDGSLPNSATVPAYSSDEEFTIAGVVTNSANSFIKGASVTISAPGLLFNTGALDASTVQEYTVGSITVNASNVGAYSVEVRSNLSGAQTVTVTSGAAVKTVVVTFDAPLEANATQLSVETPASTEVGSSFQAVVSLKDVFGNAVETSSAKVFTLTYSGKGMALTVPDNTGADGTATFGVLVGANDKGTGTVTASYNGDASLTTTDDNITVVNTIAIGSGAVVADQKVNAGSFKGYVALYAKGYEGQRMSAKVGADWVVVPALASGFERVVEFTGAGVDVAVRIYIDRVLLDTINLVTK